MSKGDFQEYLRNSTQTSKYPNGSPCVSLVINGDSGEKINDSDIKDIVEYLKNRGDVTVLALPRNNITDEGVKILAEFVKNDKTLRSINLNDNKFGDEGVKALTDSLIGNTTFNNLSIARNNIGTKSAEYIANLVEKSTNVIHINIPGNNISTPGEAFLILRTTITLENKNINNDGKPKTIAKKKPHTNEGTTWRQLSESEIKERNDYKPIRRPATMTLAEFTAKNKNNSGPGL
jgi:Ran GTPase-activating protein (RanGAP) involved in mRNA processing and transport